eukprot:404229-Prymnesium_polylepis.1
MPASVRCTLLSLIVISPGGVPAPASFALPPNKPRLGCAPARVARVRSARGLARVEWRRALDSSGHWQRWGNPKQCSGAAAHLVILCAVLLRVRRRRLFIAVRDRLEERVALDRALERARLCLLPLLVRREERHGRGLHVLPIFVHLKQVHLHTSVRPGAALSGWVVGGANLHALVRVHRRRS